MASKGRKTANSQGRRKGRITRSMASEANSDEAVTPQQSAELGERWGRDVVLASQSPLGQVLGPPWLRGPDAGEPEVGLGGRQTSGRHPPQFLREQLVGAAGPLCPAGVWWAWLSPFA